MIQPLLDTTTLGQKVLGASQPDPDHPFLAALSEVVSVTNSRFSVDAQVTNFTWDGSGLTLHDVGTPFMWDDNGDSRFEFAPFARMIPAPARALATWDLKRVLERWKEPRSVALDVVANLYREGLVDWVEPAITAFNRAGFGPPITAAEAEAIYAEDRKTFPRIVALQRAERWWQDTVRRQTYQWFVWSTYD